MAKPLNDLSVSVSLAQMVNLAQITVYPTETVGAPQAIWTARSILRVAPGQTREISCPFRDENGERVGAVDVQSLVAGTDYNVYDNRDGTGFNYASGSSFTISMTIEATRAVVTMESSAIGPLYVTTLQIRGKPLRTYDPILIDVADTLSQASYEKRSKALDLTMQSDPVFAQAYGEYLIGRFAEPTLTAESLTVRNRAVFDSVNVFSIDLFDKVTINDRQSAADELQHWVCAVEYDLMPGSFEATLRLERADDRQYCLLSKAGYAELDSTTRLGF